MPKSVFKWLMMMAVFSFLCGAAFAQAPPPSPADSTSLASLQQLVNTVRDMFGSNLVATFSARALGIAHRLDNIALGLAGGLAVAGLLWNVSLALINRDPVVETVAEAVLFASLVGFLLRSYDGPVTWVISLGDQILNTVSAGGIPGAVSRFLGSFYQSFIGMAIKTGNNLMVMDIFNIALTLADFSISVLLLLVACWFGFFALIELIGVLFLGPIVVGIAVALTPIFIACLITGWTRKWFEQWLNFLVNGAMITALTAIVLELMTAFISVPIAANGFLLGETIAMALICAGLGKIFSSIPGFADAILPGRTGASAMTAGKGMPGGGGGKGGGSGAGGLPGAVASAPMQGQKNVRTAIAYARSKIG